MADLSTTIESQAAEPAAAAVDGQSATNRSIGDLIRADQYLAGKVAAKKRRRGLSYSRLIPPGALSDCGRADVGGFGQTIY